LSIRKYWKYLAITSLSIIALAFAACGGDDDGGSSGTSGATGSDEKFVADICKAGKTFSDEITKLSSSITDPSKAADAFAKPFETFAKAFAKAAPPKDLKSWHDDASKSLNDIVKKLKGGDLEEAFSAFDGDPFPDPPKSASDRLTKVAEKNKDCKDADFTFGQ
jgi:hypothetical protein